jgi:hypothetical protein
MTENSMPPPPAPAHSPQPAQYSAPSARPLLAPGTSTSTPWIWVIVLLPMVSLGSMWLMDPATFLPATDDPLEAQMTALRVWTDPSMLLVIGLSYLSAAITIVAAFFDYRALQRAGVVRPFHWAWAFATLFVSSLVYVIGRTVIVGKVSSGRGMAPLWGAIAVTVLGTVNVGFWTYWFISRSIEWAFTVGGV